jgi:hypothetical protein
MVIGYRCQTEMSGPDVQRDLDPRGLFAPHNDISELMAFFGFQLRYSKISGPSRIDEGAMVLQAYVSGSRAAGSTNSLSSSREEQYVSVVDHPP